MRSVRADAYIRPNEGRRKVYIFPDCGLLTEQDQNVLLKIVEDGSGESAALLEAAESLCRAIGSKKRGAAAELAVRLEKKRIPREDLAAALAWTRDAFAAALILLYGRQPEGIYLETASFLSKNLTKSQIMRTIELLQKYRGECAYNVGPGHVLGALAVELEDIF